MPLTHGGAVKLTTSRYFTPSGASIHGKGIIPDIVEEGPEETPAELITGKGALPLEARDKEVHFALDTLKTKVALARGQAAPLSVRALVP
jgi:carboxyl-terminal processing protease